MSSVFQGVRSLELAEIINVRVDKKITLANGQGLFSARPGIRGQTTMVSYGFLGIFCGCGGDVSLQAS